MHANNPQFASPWWNHDGLENRAAWFKFYFSMEDGATDAHAAPLRQPIYRHRLSVQSLQLNIMAPSSEITPTEGHENRERSISRRRIGENFLIAAADHPTVFKNLWECSRISGEQAELMASRPIPQHSPQKKIGLADFRAQVASRFTLVDGHLDPTPQDGSAQVHSSGISR